jgi:hypothetical protein
MKRLTLQRNWIPILVTLILGFAFVVPAAANDGQKNNQQCGYGYAYGGNTENDEQGDKNGEGDENGQGNGDEKTKQCDEDQGNVAEKDDESGTSDVIVTSQTSDEAGAQKSEASTQKSDATAQKSKPPTGGDGGGDKAKKGNGGGGD